MPRYILIDNHSGFIFGDTADMAPGVIGSSDVSPTLAARWLDENLVGQFGREYELIGRNPNDTSTGYHVYRADIDGSEAVPVVHNGQDRETIAAVERSCRYEGFVRCHSPTDD
ncbi:MAG TPA: hypothetical protein VGR63_15370 [Casimicrobiaceae bacterium]|jgi:hypothetical protein|nr:hypothetical protein [Casimicrobiaceae bacterium]